ncbi:MAG: S-methyl-5-thioribose-1-phosphate isomerase [Chloroflexi bacterium]|nr:MAG: S-methyl-5-thioribose-1-phosphate isomerase [Chloroflexota bacterium]
MRTVEWDPKGAVKMIDQRRLPLEFVVLELADPAEVADAIEDMAIRGAPAIGAAAAFGLALAARQSPAGSRQALLADLESAAGLLRATRPTAVNLFWAIDRMLRCAQSVREDGPQAVVEAVIAEAQRIADEDVAINRRIGAHGAALVEDGFRILTHCNAGALATVDYGTALAVVRTAHEQGKGIHVWVDETRPRLQGARLTAWELMNEGIPMTLIADNVAGHLLRTGQVDLVVVGSDRTVANGDVANKIGTYKLAVLARENGVPFYAAVPTSTIDLSIQDGDQIPIEERSAEEVTHPGGCQVAPDGVAVLNLAFDVTPHRYVTGIITENGVAYPPFKQSLRRMVEHGQISG